MPSGSVACNSAEIRLDSKRRDAIVAKCEWLCQPRLFIQYKTFETKGTSTSTLQERQGKKDNFSAEESEKGSEKGRTREMTRLSFLLIKNGWKPSSCLGSQTIKMSTAFPVAVAGEDGVLVYVPPDLAFAGDKQWTLVWTNGSTSYGKQRIQVSIVEGVL